MKRLRKGNRSRRSPAFPSQSRTISASGRRHHLRLAHAGEFSAPCHAAVTEKLLENDMVVTGKCNMDEFAMGSSCETPPLSRRKNRMISQGSRAAPPAVLRRRWPPWNAPCRSAPIRAAPSANRRPAAACLDSSRPTAPCPAMAWSPTHLLWTRSARSAAALDIAMLCNVLVRPRRARLHLVEQNVPRLHRGPGRGYEGQADRPAERVFFRRYSGQRPQRRPRRGARI